MKIPLRVLLIEDCESDAALIVRQLEKAGYAVLHKRVETPAQMKAALLDPVWEIITADYHLPELDAPSALEILQQTGLDIPFIVISGAIGEETAVALFRSGACDYLMKGNLARLAPVVKRELMEAVNRRERKQAEERLQNSREQYRYLVELSPDAIFVNRNWRIDFVNPAALELFGATLPEQILGKSPYDVFHPDYHSIVHARVRRMMDVHEPVPLIEEKIVRLDGTIRDVEVAAAPFTDVEGEAIQVILRDITERKQAEKLLRETNAELEIAYDATLQGWSKALELRERETAGHSQRVVEWTLNLARALGVDQDALVDIHRGALLHDIGKMGIPDSILLKPGPLNNEEWEVMRKHPTYAFNLLSNIPYLSSALDIPHFHHERWDGSGYPLGLSRDTIPLAARIFAVIDVWDALSYDRPYRKAWPKEKIIQYLKDQAGKQLDPQVVEVFLRLHNDNISYESIR